LRRARAAAGPDVAPKLSVWHGTDDRTVDPVNAAAIVDQWRDLHGIGEAPGRVDTVAGHRRERWFDARGGAVVERYDVRGMGHGTPIDTRGAQACGASGPHMLEAGICSTRLIAASWGLIAEGKEQPARVQRTVHAAADPTPSRTPRRSSAKPNGVGSVIEDALRAAGLMR